MSKRPSPSPVPSPLPQGLGRGGKRRKTDPPLPQQSAPGGPQGGLPPGQPTGRTGGGGMPVKHPSTAAAAAQSNPEVQQRNQVAMQMLKMILPSPGPYAQLPLSSIPQLHTQLCMHLESRQPQPVRHALNVLSLASFEWRSNEAMQLGGYPELAKLLVQLALDGLSSSSPSPYTEVPPSPSSHPSRLTRSKDAEWAEAERWWWDYDEDLFVDHAALSERLTWTTAACDIIRNFSFHEHNRDVLLGTAVLELVNRVLHLQQKDPCPLHNELLAILLQTLQNLSSRLKLNMIPASLSLPQPRTSLSPHPSDSGPVAPTALTHVTLSHTNDTDQQSSSFSESAKQSQALTQHLSRVLTDPDIPLRLRTLALHVLCALCQQNPQHVVQLLLLGDQQRLWALVELLGCSGEMAREAAEREAEGEINYLDLIKVEELSQLDLELLSLHTQAEAVEAATQLISTLLTAARKPPTSVSQTPPTTTPPDLPHDAATTDWTQSGARHEHGLKGSIDERGVAGMDVGGRSGASECGTRQGSEAGKEREEDGLGTRGGRSREDRPPLQILVGDARLVMHLVEISSKRAPSMAARHGTHLSKLQDRTKHPLLYAGTLLADRAASLATSILRTIAEDASLRPCLKPYELDLALEAMSNGPFAEAYSAILTML